MHASMNARPTIKAEAKVSQGPVWGLNEQLGRLGKNHGGDCSTAGEQRQDRAERSKIRVSVCIAHKIEEVRVPTLSAHWGQHAVFSRRG